MGAASTESLLKKGLFLLLLAVFCRLIFLEFTDLIDPTEARYASVAQEMVISNDWTTPKLPRAKGVEPYLGKPPFHFWLTALSYELFGFEEWTSRLPSFLSALVILYLVGSVAVKYFDRKTALLACWMALSSGMFFFLAGASVVDVTLTALVSLSFIAICFFFEDQERPKLRYALLAAVFAALGFLTKGPVAIVLIGLPVFLWLLANRQLSLLRRFPWVKATLVFSVVAAPWFILSEIANPGFLKYFFWNENFARYLFKDYGDRYGIGHTQVYGMSWMMMFLAFCPWTLVVFYTIWRKGLRWTAELIKADRYLKLTLIWGLSSALFFTFVRQLHAMYILPALPGLAIFSARLVLQAFEHAASPAEKRRLLSTGTAIPFVALVGAIGVIVAGLLLSPSSIYTLVTAIPLAFIISCLMSSRTESTCFGSMIHSSASLVAFYLIILLSMTSFVQSHRSTSQILKKIADAHPRGDARIGLIATTAYSPYWTTKAWKSELSAPVDVYYVDPAKIGDLTDVSDILLRIDHENRISKKNLNDFETMIEDGGWKWIRRTRENQPARLTYERSIPEVRALGTRPESTAMAPVAVLQD